MNTVRCKRRDFLKTVGLAEAAMAMPRSLRAAAKDKLANFIIILTDDQGY